MTCILDCIFHYQDGVHTQPASHWVRLYDCGSWMTLLITDRSHKYICNSVTNSIEALVTAFLWSHPEVTYERLVIIEHYDEHPKEFDLVSFKNPRVGVLSDPVWNRINEEQAKMWCGMTSEKENA